jgi:ELWxxDGT repeat protein
MRAVSVAIASLLLVAPAGAQSVAESPVFLVKNINTAAGRAHPEVTTSIAATNGTIFYFGRTEYIVEQLWTSDGTAEGTNPIADFALGHPDYGPHDLTVMGGSVFFSARTNEGVRQLYLSDGTGAIQLSNLSSFRAIPETAAFAVAGSTLFFPVRYDRSSSLL